MKKSLFLAVCAAFALNLSAVELAKYNGKIITNEDIDPIILPSGQAISVLNLNKEEQKNIITDYLFSQELTKEAKANKYDNDKEFKEAVEKQKNKILLEYYHHKSILSQKITDKEIEKFYNDNKADFIIKSQTQVAHILVKTEKEAKDIIKQLSGLKDEALVKKFIELAQTKSEEPAAKQTGGMLPLFTKDGKIVAGGGEFDPNFVKAANAVKVGNISDVVKTKFGYHVILKLNETKDQTITLEQAKERIKSGLQVEKYKKTLQEKKNTFVKKSKIEFK